MLNGLLEIFLMVLFASLGIGWLIGFAGRDKLKSQGKKLKMIEEEVGPLREQVEEVKGRVAQVNKSGGRVWELPVAAGSAPRFRPFSAGLPPIVAVMNLKGGVGKTTIAANLGAAFWQHGRRVMLVDLDFQASLTSLCLDAPKIQELRDGQRFVHSLFSDEPVSAEHVSQCLSQIGGSRGFLLAADEALVDAESRLMHNWLLGQVRDDVRFRLRSLLHSPEIQGRFDVILIDCPPRLTTASVNALAASDFVLVPAQLDATSAERVPSLLRWLRRLKDDVGLCPALNVLGVVANEVRDKGKLSPREQQIWKRLKVSCPDRWGESVYHFTSAVPLRENIRHAADQNKLAALADKEMKTVFAELAAEVAGRIPGLKEG